MTSLEAQHSYAQQLDFPVFSTTNASLATPDENGTMVYLDVSAFDQARGIRMRSIVEHDITVEPANMLAHEMWCALASCGCVNHAHEGLACPHDIIVGNDRRRLNVVELFPTSN